MKTQGLRVRLLVLAGLVGAVAPLGWGDEAGAASFGMNITVSDGVSQGTGWYGNREDQEVEPGCVANQSWDLEGFFLQATTLSVVGGFDFVLGNERVRSGDIFIDVDGDAKYGLSNNEGPSANATVSNTFGYDYVLDLDFASKTYSVYQLDKASTVSVYYSQNIASNPWRYASGGAALAGWGDRTFSFYDTGLTDAQTGFQGGAHNAFGLDLSFLAPGTDFTAHFTMECGNDNLMGRGEVAPVPEPASLLLLGTGLLGLAAKVRRRKP